MLTSSKWVSLDITRTNQLKKLFGKIQAGWIWIDRIHTFLWIWFIGSWVIDTFRQWTLKFSRKKCVERMWYCTFFFQRNDEIFQCSLFEISKEIFQQCQNFLSVNVFYSSLSGLGLGWSREKKTGAASFKYTSFACTFFLSVDDEVGRFWCLTNE